MTVKPILFSGPMVRALLEGRKTQTRRVLKSPRDGSGWYRHPETGAIINSMGGPLPAVPYAPGDLLWVREAWCTNALVSGGSERSPAGILYRADGDWFTATTQDGAEKSPWKPSIHMPRWASRLTLEVTGVKVERLQEISEEDAIAEGIEVDQSGRFSTIGWRNYSHDNHPFNSAVASFRSLWNSLNAKRGYGWDDNPWVIAVSFRVHHANVGTVLEREAVNV